MPKMPFVSSVRRVCDFGINPHPFLKILFDNGALERIIDCSRGAPRSVNSFREIVNYDERNDCVGS